MREFLTVLGFFIFAVAFRCSRRGGVRKIGALLFLATSGLAGWFLTDHWWGILVGVLAWFFLPWIELLTRIRGMRLPLENKLNHHGVPNQSFYPHADEAAAAMEEEGFEHVTDCGWDWAGMKQVFRLFWHPEERAIAAVCLCEQSDVAFAFVSITSFDETGRTWRTTNFPFSSTLKCAPGVRWNHVPCERNCFHHILRDHRGFLGKMGVGMDDLRMPDPDDLEADIEKEMKDQVQRNLDDGIIVLTEDGYFRYSARGLFFLWGQFVKDMLRLC
jgi:hypothetical protein